MTQLRIPAVFMRGGTSKAVMLKEADLPRNRAEWPGLFARMLGSPDPSARQLDGMGGGVSSLSKVCVIGPSSRADADIDYTFAQVVVKTGQVDFAGNCGNMSSAVGPFAVDEGLVSAPRDGEALVRIHNTNSGKIIHARFAMRDGEAEVEGGLAIPGVSGTGAPVRLTFLDPAGTRGRGLFPAGAVLSMLPHGPDGRIAATLVDAAVPAVFVAAADLGLAPGIMPAELDTREDILALLEDLRCAGSAAMGIAPDTAAARGIAAVPKIALVGAPAPYRALDGSLIEAGEHDILVRMISAGQPHRALPITGSLAVAAALATPGSLLHKIAGPQVAGAAFRIGSPSGIITVEAETAPGPKGIPAIASATILRTQRRLMEGWVRVPAPSADEHALPTGE